MAVPLAVVVYSFIKDHGEALFGFGKSAYNTEHLVHDPLKQAAVMFVAGIYAIIQRKAAFTGDKKT